VICERRLASADGTEEGKQHKFPFPLVMSVCCECGMGKNSCCFTCCFECYYRFDLYTDVMADWAVAICRWAREQTSTR